MRPLLILKLPAFIIIPSAFAMKGLRFLFPVVFGAFLAVPTTVAQDATPDSTQSWTKALTGKLSGTQAGFQNWAEGGVNTLAWSMGLDGRAEREDGAWTQRHTVRLSYGLVKQDTLDFRKAEDLIRLTSTFNYAGDGFLNKFQPTVAVGIRTQFRPGYNFEKNPFGDGRTPPVKVSDFLSPGTFTQSIGMSYQHSEWFRQRLGIGAKETVVLIDELRSLYAVSADKNVRFELGIEAFSEFDKELFENVHYTSTLGLFAAFNKPDAPDFLWENLVSMKVNSWLQVNFEWVFLYDEDVTSLVQVKEVATVGIVYHFL